MDDPNSPIIIQDIYESDAEKQLYVSSSDNDSQK